MFGRHKSRDEALQAELAQAARKALDEAMKGAEPSSWSFRERGEQVWLEEDSIDLVELERVERELAAVMVGTEVWDRFERLRGGRVQVEVVARPQTRGTRLTRRRASP